MFRHLFTLLAAQGMPVPPCENLIGTFGMSEGPGKLSGNIVFKPDRFDLNLAYDGTPYKISDVYYTMACRKSDEEPCRIMIPPEEYTKYLRPSLELSGFGVQSLDYGVYG
ncbi:hypothetical protein FOL47_008052 [Perkinsus chesapeaki]|uniref:Uncharacterized protein n=1 Tax=Perkinsus chesapeaki TaxID=330153 RepID=A0A7J6N211_PERCH|nr:hypothetical protein FOL47_008052 [Perkinsus chesapeaki]